MNSLKAIFPEAALDMVVSKMKELGIRGAYEAFDCNGSRYMAIYTTNLTLYFFCKSLLSPEEREFFY